MTHLFVYGSLQLPEVFQAVTGRLVPAEPARLPDHARYCLRGRSYPGLVREAGAATEGLVWRDLEVADLARLDAFEDDFYERRRVSVVLASGARLTAAAYVVPRARRALIDPRPWDLEDFRRHALRDFLAGRAP